MFTQAQHVGVLSGLENVPHNAQPDMHSTFRTSLLLAPLLAILTSNISYAQRGSAEITISIIDVVGGDSVVVPFQTPTTETELAQSLYSDFKGYEMHAHVLDTFNFSDASQIAMAERWLLGTYPDPIHGRQISLSTGCGGSYLLTLLRPTDRWKDLNGEWRESPRTDTMRVRIIDACEADFSMQIPFAPGTFEVVVCDLGSLRWASESMAERLGLSATPAMDLSREERTPTEWIDVRPRYSDISGAVRRK